VSAMLMILQHPPQLSQGGGSADESMAAIVRASQRLRGSHVLSQVV
jgi:hypothetical protein